MSERKKILFVISSIHGGGAERQMQYLLRYIDRKKFEPHLAVYHVSGKEKEVVPEDIPVYDLSTKLRPASFFLIFKLKKLIKKLHPERIVSFMWGTNLISIIAGGKTRVFVGERSTPSKDIVGYSFCKIRKKLISVFYKKADKIIACSEFVKKDLMENFKISGKKIKVIYNAVDINKISNLKEAYEPGVSNYILGCGRLDPYKNFKVLVEAAAEIEIPLVILGDGPLREELVKKAKALGVDLILPGFVKNPYPYFGNAKVFCLTSRYEGLPNVVLEAMAAGCPVAATGSFGGIREIIDDRVDGLIVGQNDPAALAAAVGQILSDDKLRRRITEKAYEKAAKIFSIKEMVNKYQNLLLSRNNMSQEGEFE